jgi:hypothetical protein
MPLYDFQEAGDLDSGEILEEIRHAEAIASIRNNASPLTTVTPLTTPSRKCNGIDSNTQPHSPLKLRLNPGK